MNNLSVMFQLELSHFQGVMLHKILTNMLSSCVNNHCSFIKILCIRHSVLWYKSLKMARSGMKNVCPVDIDILVMFHESTITTNRI